jgi:DNA-directed RNA polymerase specialized sigma24 family protein
MKRRKRSDLAAAFKAVTFPHLETIFRDACCLAGSRDEAGDLVIAAYARAFLHYEAFRRGRTRNAVNWLYANLHAVFCDEILARANRSRIPTGG